MIQGILYGGAGTALFLACACAPAPEAASAPAALRAIWVTRFDYRTPADVDQIVESCAAAGFDTLLFQVRGNATAFYGSELEPRAIELEGEDPGFDPLARALARSRERGIALHAWINVVPAWWGTEPPRDPAQLVNARPDWLWYDQEGRRQEHSENFYVSLNPCLPEVRAHLAAVVEELLARYALDGLHLDYLRFPNEPPAVLPGQDFPRDARTLALYREASGLAPDDDRERWDAWRTACITTLLEELRAVQRRVRPGIPLSVAVGPEVAPALRHHQDYEDWIERGLVDALYPMNYSPDAALFERRLAAWAERATRLPVVMGLRVDACDDEELARRMRLASESSEGFALFAYSSFFDSRNVAIDRQDEERSAERARRRAALLPLGLK